MVKIHIANDYSDTPGSRFESEGPFSGERFRDEMLIPKYEEALAKDEKLVINLDGGYGYATSFLEEAFGGMVRHYKNRDFVTNVVFISEDEPSLVDEIHVYIEEAEVE